MQFPLQNILKAYVLLDDLHWILSSEYYSLNSPLWQNLRSTQPKLALPVTMNAIRRARGVWTIGQSNQKLWFRRLSATLSGLMLDRAILRPCHHCTEHFSSEISFSNKKLDCIPIWYYRPLGNSNFLLGNSNKELADDKNVWKSSFQRGIPSMQHRFFWKKLPRKKFL